MRNDLQDRIEEILFLINEKKSKAYICMICNCRASTLDRFLKRNKIEYSGNKGLKGMKSFTLVPIENYLKKNGFFITSHALKLKIIKSGIKERKCERCGNTEWIEKPIPIELHHKDGDRYNNELDNLEILCPNCHALEPNNCGSANKKIKIIIPKKNKNIKVVKKLKTKEELLDIRAKQRKVKNRPPKDELVKLINEKGYVSVGKMFGVSDNAIRKWIKYYETH